MSDYEDVIRDETSCCRQDRPFDGLRQFDQAKECLGIEIIISGFVDDPHESVSFGVDVSKRYIDFSFSSDTG